MARSLRVWVSGGIVLCVLLAGLPQAPGSLPRAVGTLGGAQPVGPRVSSGTQELVAASHSLAAPSAKWYNLTGVLNPSPSPRSAGAMVWDAKDGYVLLYGGEDINATGLTDTWTYRAGAWTQQFPSLHPSARIAQSMAYDTIDQCVVLYGGISLVNSAFLGDTWEYAAGIWTNVTGPTAPVARATASMAWDPDISSLVLFGGQNTSGALGDTWRFVGGTWTELFPPSSPSGRVFPALVYDAADGYLLLFGGASTSANFADTYKFANGTWTELFPTAAPAGRAVWQAVYDDSSNAVLLFGGSNGNVSTVFGDTWTYHAGQWTQQFPTSSPAARQYAPMAWDPNDDYALLFEGIGLTTNSSGNVTGYQLNDTWAYVATPSATIALPHNPRDIGQTVNLSVAISGGVPPYSVAWTYGDGTSGSGLATSHAYGSAGSFSIAANVTDSFDQFGAGSAPVTIYALPTVVVSANLSTVVAHENISLSGLVTGGAPPITYVWSFGDGRASNQPGPFRVAYNATGTFTVNLTVTDGAGAQASGSASFTVNAPPVAKNSGASAPWLLVGIGVALVVVAGVAIYALARRRKPPAPPTGASAPASWSPPPPPPPARP